MCIDIEWYVRADDLHAEASDPQPREVSRLKESPTNEESRQGSSREGIPLPKMSVRGGRSGIKKKRAPETHGGALEGSLLRE